MLYNVINTIPYANAILVTLRLSDKFLSIQTLDRLHGRSERFLMEADRLAEFLHCPDGYPRLLDCDLRNHLSLRRVKEYLYMRITWLRSINHCGDLSGYEQDIVISPETFEKALAGGTVRYLYDPEVRTQSHVTFLPSAQKQVARISKEACQKRALVKALRQSFQWGAQDHVYLCSDWGYDFAFSSDGLNGGLCRHERTVVGRDGRKHPCVEYSTHT